MNFLIMNRSLAIEYSNMSDIDNTLMISISNIDDCVPDINVSNPKLVQVAFYFFDDVDIGDTGCMNFEQALSIVNIYKHFKDSVDTIVVHCTGGVSRSAGVCAALMKIHTGDDMSIFSQARYCPNMTCYRRVLEAYFGEYDEEDAQRKWDINTRAYQEQEGLLDED